VVSEGSDGKKHVCNFTLKVSESTEISIPTPTSTSAPTAV
jgi:hypothetical protein